MQRKPLRIFLAVSGVIAILDLIFVLANIHFARQTFSAELAEEGRVAQAVFQASLEQTSRHMASLATFIAGDPTVQALFRDGRDAVRAEGGGLGGPRAAAARQALLDAVAPSWRLVQDRFDTRQLHFHLGPGDVSFLRVHAPGKFGDDLSDIRPLIVAVNRDGTPRAGFEIGRIYAGLRGAVPVVMAAADGGVDRLGVLEVGTSMQPLLDGIAEGGGWSLATVLLTRRVGQAMWDDYERALFPAGGGGGDYVVEAATGPQAVPLIDGLRALGDDAMEAGTAIVPWNGRQWLVSHFPLRDFLGQEDPGRGAVGAVLMWRDATAAVDTLSRALLFNVLYAAGTFLVLEALLVWTFRAVNRHLRHEVAEKTAALARSNRDLEEFVYVASHDLREPLRMVISYLGLISRRYEDRLDDQGRDFIGFAQNGARRMDAMIRSLLDLSRVTSRGAALVRLSLQEVAEEAVANLAVGIAERDAEVVVTPTLPEVVGDRPQLTRLIQNLIANGLKFQPAGNRPRIVLWSDRDPQGRWRLHVLDNGLGIPPEKGEQIFHMFQRLHGQEDYEGSGMGLAICRRIAEYHQGSLTVSPAPAGGSVFTLTLPGADP
jgi:signal transduction histidine kinase